MKYLGNIKKIDVRKTESVDIIASFPSTRNSTFVLHRLSRLLFLDAK